MTGFKAFVAAMVAVFAFGAMVAASAMAAHQWLNSSGLALTKVEATLIDGTVILHHKFPAIIGGEVLIECTGQGHGTVGPGAEDEATSVLGLKGETSKVDCIVIHSTQSLCPEKELILVSSLHLPWKTLIELVGATVFDTASKTGTKAQPGYETECKSLKVSCEANDRAVFTGNGTNGAKFMGRGETTASCTDGGTGTVLGSGEVLGGFAIS